MFRLNVPCKTLDCNKWLNIETDNPAMIETLLIRNNGHFTNTGRIKYHCPTCEREYTQMKREMKATTDMLIRELIKQRIFNMFESLISPMAQHRR